MQINFLNRKKKSTSSFSETDSLETQNSLFFVVPPPKPLVLYTTPVLTLL